MGLTIDPSDGSLWFVNSRTSEVGRVAALQQCPAGTGLDVSSTPPAEAFANEICSTPNTTALGNTVAHPNHDCSYINQSDMCLGEMYGSSRGDKCRGDGSYNLDMLLMTGHYCHKCLPSPCLNGGTCENIWNRAIAASVLRVSRATTASIRRESGLQIYRPARTQNRFSTPPPPPARRPCLPPWQEHSSLHCCCSPTPRAIACVTPRAARESRAVRGSPHTVLIVVNTMVRA